MAMVFVSYSGHDGEKIAEALQEEVSADAFFVAHRSIEVGKEWEQTIWQNLHAARWFVFIVTDEYNKSPYAQQELGAAMALQKDIIPLLGMGKTPEDLPGFAKKYQARVLSGQDTKDKAEAVLRDIAEKKAKSNKDALIVGGGLVALLALLSRL